MPNLAQVPLMPSTTTVKNETDEGRWINGFNRTFLQLWFIITSTINALCKVDTLANRTTTPDLNETFFVTSNTSQLWAGVTDVWVNVGPRRGLTAIANAATSVTITLSPAEPDASYIVTLTPTYSTTAYVVEANKAAGQFVATFGTAAGASDSVNWVLWRA